MPRLYRMTKWPRRSVAASMAASRKGWRTRKMLKAMRSLFGINKGNDFTRNVEESDGRISRD